MKTFAQTSWNLLAPLTSVSLGRCERVSHPAGSQKSHSVRTACAQRAVSVRSADTLRSRRNVGLAL